MTRALQDLAFSEYLFFVYILDIDSHCPYLLPWITFKGQINVTDRSRGCVINGASYDRSLHEILYMAIQFTF